MSEHEPQLASHEKQPSVENSAEQKEKLQHLLEKAEHARHEHEGHEEQLGHAAKQEAVTGQEIQGKIAEGVHDQGPQDLLIQQQTKKSAYKKVLKQAQRHLSKPERTASRIIHQPVIESVSEVGSKTVARPSGLLAGGFCALLGSGLLFYMAKHYGYRYNFFVFLVFLGGGFVLGLVIELIWRAMRPAPSS